MTQETTALLEVSGSSAIRAWGQRAQMIKACEELAELTTQLCKWLNGSPTKVENIVDEVADALIVTFQMRTIFGDEDVDKRIAYKIERLTAAISRHYKKEHSL